MRRYEVQVEGGQGWVPRAQRDLQPGEVYRAFEADGTPVEEDGVYRWRVVTVSEEGLVVEPVPESDVERQARLGGWWPGTGPNLARPIRVLGARRTW